MTSIRIPNNYFAPRAYVKSDPATGLLATRKGNRLIAVPEFLIRSIHATLRSEAGQAAPLALYTFGYWWGRAFYDRVRDELEEYYGTAIAQMNAVEFLGNMRQMWSTHGLGKLQLDFRYREYRIVLVTTENSALSLGTEDPDMPWHHLEAGAIAAWFSRWAAKEIRACAIDWEGKRTQFLVGLPTQVDQAERWVRQGMRTTEILQKFADGWNS